MERKRMMDTTTKRQSHWWWFDSHGNTTVRSQWLQSTLSALDDKTKAMLRIIEEDADSFSQRAEMYYKKRPQLVGLVEDFYRAHRSLAEQFDHLRHDPGTRRTSPLSRSFSLSNSQQPEKAIEPRKSYDVCFAKLAHDSDDLFSSPLPKGVPDKPLDRLKPFGGRYTDLAYDSDDTIDSEVDDPMPEGSFVDVDDLGEELSLSSAEMNHTDIMGMANIDRIDEESMIQKKQLMEKENAIEELKLKLSEHANEAMELKEEVEKLRLENKEMYLLKMRDAKEKEQLVVENESMKRLDEELGALRMEIQEQNEMLEEKDEKKREAIRQLSVAIEMMKGENRLLKKALANESNKRWKPFESQVFKGFGKLFNCSIISSQPSVVPL